MTVRLVEPNRRSGTIAAARSAFVIMRTSRRSLRSTMRPPAIPKSTAGRTARRMRNEEEVFECVISATRMMSALVTAFAATWDRICAAQSARNVRLRRMPRSAASVASFTPDSVGRCERPAFGEPLQVLFEIPPTDQDPPPAGDAAESDVRAEAHDAPAVAAAGVRLPQHHNVVEIEGDRALRARGRRHGREVYGPLAYLSVVPSAGRSTTLSLLTENRVRE